MRWVDKRTTQGEPVIQLMSLTNHATSSSLVRLRSWPLYVLTHTVYVQINMEIEWLEQENTYGFPFRCIICR